MIETSYRKEKSISKQVKYDDNNEEKAVFKGELDPKDEPKLVEVSTISKNELTLDSVKTTQLSRRDDMRFRMAWLFDTVRTFFDSTKKKDTVKNYIKTSQGALSKRPLINVGSIFELSAKRARVC